MPRVDNRVAAQTQGPLQCSCIFSLFLRAFLLCQFPLSVSLVALDGQFHGCRTGRRLCKTCTSEFVNLRVVHDKIFFSFLPLSRLLLATDVFLSD